MKWVFGLTGLICGAGIVVIMSQHGVITGDGIRGDIDHSNSDVTTYLTFIDIMLTATTAVLAAVAIGIGVIAAFTVNQIRESAEKTVSVAKRNADAAKADALAIVEQALSEDAINDRLDAIVRKRQLPTVAELEEDFDPEDRGER